ncbi:MAG: DUF3667 domain-containing protein, partial [Calditrichaeota bacterium]
MVQPSVKNRDSCPTCGERFSGNFCAHCGEKKIDRNEFSLRYNFSKFLSKLTNLDSRFFRTLVILLTRPGFLTQEYVRGRRKPYLSPLKLFFMINAIYFFVQPYTHVRGFNTNLYSHLNRQIYSPLARRVIMSKFHNLNDIPEAYKLRFDAKSKT